MEKADGVAFTDYASIEGIEAGVTTIKTVTTDGSELEAFAKLIVAPQAVKNVNVKTGKTDISLSWDAIKNANGYAVYRWDEAKQEFVKISEGTATDFRDSNLEADTSYKYQIIAYINVDGVRYDGQSTAVIDAKTTSGSSESGTSEEEGTTEKTEKPTEEGTTEKTEKPTEEGTTEKTEKPTEEGTTEKTEKPTEEGTTEKAEISTEEETTEDIYVVSGYMYKVTGKKTAAVAGVSNKKKTSITVKNTVKINGETYKVTAVEANAFKDCRKLKKATIGKYVTTIGNNAFYGDKKLKKIVVKTNVLKKVGKNAIKGIDKRAQIKVPKSRRSKYKKLFKKSNGYVSSMNLQ